MSLGFCGSNPVSKNLRLDPTDAQYVQVMHTNDHYYGCPLKLGHQDFRLSLGTGPQPACLPGLLYTPGTLPLPIESEMNKCPSLGPEVTTPSIIYCGHRIVLLYLQVAMDISRKIEAVRCNSPTMFVYGRCYSNSVDRFGPFASRYQGDFFFDMDRKFPFLPAKCPADDHDLKSNDQDVWS